MSIISINNFSQNFGDKPLFEDANFSLNPGEKIGLVGLNGAGKSTLIKIITGSVLLDKGELYINKRYNIKYLDQYAEVKGENTIKEYLAGAFSHLYKIEEKLNKVNEQLGTEQNPSKLEKLMYESGDLFEKLSEENFWAIDSNIQKVASGLGVSALGLDTIVSHLSGGQRAKVMLAKLLLEDPDVMILDEPTNFLDVNHIDWLTKFIKSSDKSFIIVSHDDHFINDVVTHVCDVDGGKVTRYVGNLTKMREIKAEQKELTAKSYENQQKEIKRLQDYIDRNKARAATAKMARSRERKLEKMDMITPPSEQVEPTFCFNYKAFAGNMVVKVEDLMVGYDKPLLKQNLNFELNNGERIAISGFNGIGKSTLLKTILGITPAISGSVTIARNVVVGYYEQENNFNHFEGTPLGYITNMFPKLGEKAARAALSKCGLSSIHARKQISQLSGGEQSKIKLCVLSLTPCNLLILDEPTNHLDMLAINHLQKVISEFEGSVLFVSHSKPFVNALATRVIDLEKVV